MDKKDIYEHLAKIYLDTPTVKKKKAKSQAKDYKNFVIIGIAIVLGFSVLLSARLYLYRPLKHEFSYVLATEPIKLNLKFDPAKKEIFSFTLNKANLSKYNALNFSAKKSNFDDIVSLRIEFTNAYKERSEIYLKDISSKWQQAKVNFADFKTISDWSEMESLSFIIEEWNTKNNEGTVYIDNVRLSR